MEGGRPQGSRQALEAPIKQLPRIEGQVKRHDLHDTTNNGGRDISLTQGRLSYNAN